MQAILYLDEDQFNAVLQLLLWLHQNNKQLDSLLRYDDLAPVMDMWGAALKAKTGSE
jgi:hypothetical protein